MARYTGPKTKIARKFGEPIFGPDKVLERRNFPPGQHGQNRRRKTSEYGIQLREKQKAKYTYGVLERQFRNLFDKAARSKGITGESCSSFSKAVWTTWFIALASLPPALLHVSSCFIATSLSTEML